MTNDHAPQFCVDCQQQRRLDAHDLLVTGAVRITRLWPRALDAQVLDHDQALTIQARPTSWRCD